MTSSSPTTHPAVPRDDGSRPPAPAGGRPHRRAALLPAAAGVGYLVAWFSGLLAWPANLALDATNAQVAESYRVHAGQAATQILLVEGLAGVLVGIVLWRLLTTPRPMSSAAGPARRAAVAVAGLAVVLSLAQAALGLVLVAAADRLQITRSGELYDVFNRMDGLKMLALAVVAAYVAASRTRPLPRWLHTTAALTALALTASGCAYLLVAGSAAWTVYLSGPLLLLWVTATGLRLTPRAHRFLRPSV